MWGSQGLRPRYVGMYLHLRVNRSLLPSTRVANPARTAFFLVNNGLFSTSPGAVKGRHKRSSKAIVSKKITRRKCVLYHDNDCTMSIHSGRLQVQKCSFIINVPPVYAHHSLLRNTFRFEAWGFHGDEGSSRGLLGCSEDGGCKVLRKPRMLPRHNPEDKRFMFTPKRVKCCGGHLGSALLTMFIR
jgi:hypothetical protein